MPTYKTPGVYVEEVSTLPPSVVQVATAIPALLGRTGKGKPGEVEIAQINTLLEYELRFGKAAPTALTANDDGSIQEPASALPEASLWYAMSLYFKNGGGRCLVVSVDNHEADLAKAPFEAGLAALEREDEPTLIVMPEIVGLPQADFDALNAAALAQCHTLGDRFAVLDVKDGDVAAFRNGVTDNLDYGAAYYPYLDTALHFVVNNESVTIGTGGSDTLASIKTTNTALYNTIRKGLTEQRVTLPPSAAMAGVYARVDRDRGVWKAPANVGLASVIAPSQQVSNAEQEGLNVDPMSGKSINVIRSFAGRGTLAWGARTLAGNDNEWRYVNVRRLFIMIEESARKASAFAVFEPNDATTWLKVKGMLEGYLYGLWEQGALQGSKSDDAYYVNVGLGKTMTSQDVLAGRLVVEIGVAAVRPAEFIVLRFSHKLAEA